MSHQFTLCTLLYCTVFTPVVTVCTGREQKLEETTSGVEGKYKTFVLHILLLEVQNYYHLAGTSTAHTVFIIVCLD